MSTFNGVVAEFPEIRIDYFRQVPQKTPPLACFLSHVHSDHLQGLESLKSPFIYCSHATRELLLRLEKFPHRMNFTKGILETRKVHYKHLKNLLRPVPLHVPTEIELTPGRVIRVTLFDANHCAGAVMFLIDDASNAILYTGDIRAEPWWINTIARDPVLMPYTSGLKRLDSIYLDTTFATKSNRYGQFPTKAEGLKELLTKVTAYPDDTVFHFNAWTFGYEGVWLALASSLRSQVHVDQYKWRLYSALASCPSVTPQDGSALCGYRCGNGHQPGCLTVDESVRLHCCESGMECNNLKSSKVVWITPIITRATDGVELPEIGTGGGAGDLEQLHELDLRNPTMVNKLVELCSREIPDTAARESALRLISEAVDSGAGVVSFQECDFDDDLENMPLKKVTKLLQKIATSTSRKFTAQEHTTSLQVVKSQKSTSHLPVHITFPYSRHSSYEELCQLVDTFKPMDVWPCTVDDVNWDHSVSMKTLFGHLCSENLFVHDKEMIKVKEARALRRDRSSRAVRWHLSQSSYTLEDSQDHLAEFKDVSPESELHACCTSVNKMRRSASDKRIESVKTPLHGRQETAALSTGTSGEKRVRSIKTSFEAGVLRGVTIQSPIKPEKCAAEVLSSKRMRFLGTEQRGSSTEPGAKPHRAIEASDDFTYSRSHKLESPDILLTAIADKETREITCKLAQLLHCSVVMAQILAGVPGKHPLHELCRTALKLADDCSKDAHLVFSLADKELAIKISCLRDLLPIASEHCCHAALIKSKGDVRIARGIVVKGQEQRFADLAVAGFSKDVTEASLPLNSDPGESQPSLPDSAFESQESTGADAQAKLAGIPRRKEAYRAAVGKDGRDWSSLNLMFSSSLEGLDEVELG